MLAKKEKIKLALIYGGRSGEHEVSCVSAVYLLNNLSKSKYDIYPILIDHDGQMHYTTEREARLSVETGVSGKSKIACQYFQNR